MTKNIIFLFSLFISCEKSEGLVITDVTKPKTDTLFLKKDYTYSSYSVKIKGQINDAVFVNGIPLNGKTDTLIRRDFYGDENNFLVLKYAPGKATKGELIISHYAR